MSYNTSIWYNNQDAFYPLPTPLVALDYRNIYYTELWGKEEVIILNGQITGCTFQLLTVAQQKVLQNFSQDFQPLQIFEVNNGVSGIVYESDFVEISSINFSTTKYLGVVPYTITLRSYPAQYFSGFYGVLNPIDKWEYQEAENLSMDAIHTVSCQGINISRTNSNALSNAQNWVYGRTGLNNSVAPLFIKDAFTNNYCQLILNEEIDRINARYSVTERYITDLTRSGYGVLRYTTNVTSGQNLITIGIQGTVQGCNRDIIDARTVFQEFNVLGAANNSYSGVIQENDLNPNPIIQNVTEDIYNATISFNYSFNNDPSPPVTFDYTVTLNSGNFIQASIEGNIIARSGDVYQRFLQATGYATTINPYALVTNFYNQFYPYANLIPLNSRATVSGMRMNPIDGTVTLNVTFNNSDQVDVNLDYFHYVASFNPPIEKLDSKPEIDVNGTNFNVGNYSIIDLGYKNRVSLNINGTSLINENSNIQIGLTAIKNNLNKLLSQFANGNGNITLDEEEITADRYDQRLINFNVTWSFDSANVVALYTNIITLSV